MGGIMRVLVVVPTVLLGLFFPCTIRSADVSTLDENDPAMVRIRLTGGGNEIQGLWMGNQAGVAGRRGQQTPVGNLRQVAQEALERAEQDIKTPAGPARFQAGDVASQENNEEDL